MNSMLTKLKNKQQLDGQILIVTLLTLIIVAVVVVGVVATANRDVQQTVSNQKYQQVYNSGETAILRLIDKYGNPGVALTELQSDFPDSNCFVGVLDEVTCEFQDADGVITELEIDETNVVEDYQLRKDESFVIRLEGYRGEITMDWPAGAALEFALFYKVGTEVFSIQDLFDDAATPVFDSSGDSPFSAGSSQHPFNFQPDPGGQRVTFSVDGITGLPLSGSTTESIRVTARTPDNSGPIDLDISGTGLPDQIRQFTATSYDPISDVDTVAVIVTQIPLLPPIASVFSQAVGTPDELLVTATVAPGLEGGGCAFGQKTTRNVNFTIPANTGAACPWLIGDNLGPQDSRRTARNDISVPIPIASDEEICAINNIALSGNINYDDLFVLRLNDVALITHDLFMSRFLTDGPFRIYDWLRIRGNTTGSRNTVCIGGQTGNNAQCSMPFQAATDGALSLAIPAGMEQSLVQRASQSGNLNMIATIVGDDDAATDCQMRGAIQVNMDIVVADK